ncbi:MAG: TIGR03790 family protein [Candidatus Eisenbacteria bacterium]
MDGPIEKMQRFAGGPGPRGRQPRGGPRRGVPVPPPAAPGFIAAAVLTVAVFSILGGCSGQPLPMGDETRVLVVARRSDPASYRVAVHYAETRRIAPTHVVFLDLPKAEEVTRDTYESRILAPLVEWWNRTAPDDRPDYVAMIRGVPHKIYGSGDLAGTRASVDSELCDLPVVAAGMSPPLEGRRPNPYGRGSDEDYPPFSHERYGICLVTRIDGFTEADAVALIDRAAAAEDESARTATHAAAGQSGQAGPTAPGGSPSANSAEGAMAPTFLLDENGVESSGNDWLLEAARRLTEISDTDTSRVSAPRFTVRLDSTGTFVDVHRDLLGYAGWGSNDSSFRRGFRFEWIPGALVTTYVSSSARTFHEPKEGWEPGSSRTADPFEGTTQSLSADWVRSGATGVAGNAYEPFLDACPRPQILFPAYLSGRSLAEAYYLALPYLSWQSVVLGDPLCAPFARNGRSLSDADGRRIVPNPARNRPGS